MARNWQLLLLAGTLLSPAGAWADKKHGENQHQEESPRERVWGDDRSQETGHGAVSAIAGSTRVWGDVVYGVYGQGYARESEREKEWRKEQIKREKDRRAAREERREY